MDAGGPPVNITHLIHQKNMVTRDKGLMNNRIHMLEMEERKALKKIESTRKRAL
jgi:hypothetical protein